MKKYLIALCLIVFATQAMAIDAAIGLGGGILSEKGQKSVAAYSVTVDLPIVTKVDSSYSICNVTDYTYADRTQDKVVHELSIIRSMFMYQRELTSWMNVAIGTGAWKIIDNQGNDPEHIALRLQFGFKILGVTPTLSQDVVRINEGCDMYYSAFNVNFF